MQTVANGTVYTCSRCSKRYFRPEGPNGIARQCCVVHGADECCHWMERQVTKKGWMKA